ncbi:MAG TPA: hypothetical protein VGQ93_15475 [Lysobacter sp.]|jgi:hypothetical protein|nr:hypothetical protein [Lysobacter sp.]
MPAHDLSDPRWFPTDYDAKGDVFRMSTITLDAIGSSAFLDKRLGVAPEAIVTVPARDLEQVMPTVPAFLFHTAFCGSTLLARALHAPPRAVSLKEPQALLSLAMARSRGTPDNLIDTRLRTALALLARPWADGGRVLIKPTNQANNLMAPLLALSPNSRALLLYSSLEEFLLSCFKKLPEAETRIRWMAQHLIAGTRLATALGISPRQSFNLVESCVLTWFAQMELYADALAADRHDRLRTLDLRAMLAQPSACVRACSGWLRLDTGYDLEARVAAVFARDSKSGDREYDASQRELEKSRVQEAFGDIIQRACAWARERVAPVAAVPSDWKPLTF